MIKRLKSIIITTSAILVLQSCKKEKIAVEEIKGYTFYSNPKDSDPLSFAKDLIEVINRSQEKKAQESKDSTYVGFGLENEKGIIQLPKVENVEYMFVFNQQQFDEALKNANNFGDKNKSKVDFTKEFIFILIHPSKFISGLQFYDSLEAYIENETTIEIIPSSLALPYVENQNSIYNYGQNDYQVKIFKILKLNFKEIVIKGDNDDKSTIKMR